MYMPRTIADIEAEIAAVKAANPNWASHAGDKQLLTALVNEKIGIQQPSAGKYEFLLIID